MIDPDPLKPHFRVINSGGKRRAFRLEGVFWEALSSITKSDGISVAQYVSKLSDVKTGEAGLSSYLRASVMRRALEQLEQLNERFEKFGSRAILAACPAPGIIISVDKRILFQNSAFLMYLQTRFTDLDNVEVMNDMTLAIETPLIELIDEMRQDSSQPRYTGFTIGHGEQRVRG